MAFIDLNENVEQILDEPSGGKVKPLKEVISKPSMRDYAPKFMYLLTTVAL